MKINVNPMNYSSLMKKLHLGVALADRDRNAKDISRFNADIERKLLASAVKTGQVDKQFLGLGLLGQVDVMAQLQSGSFLPDELMGWSTKTILAGLAVLLLLKLKRVKK
jgi:hypothetical protein